MIWTAVHIVSLLIALPIAAQLLRRQARSAAAPALPSASEAPAERELWEPASTELSVVIPFYNPGAALRPTVERLVCVLREAQVPFEVIAVADGCTDGSEHTLEGIGTEVRVLVQPRNKGKGAALHRGFANARGTYVGFVDADGDIDPAHLLAYWQLARVRGLQVVYADKRLPESVSHSSSSRKIISLGFSTLVEALVATGVQDTQTGCKLFERSALAQVLPALVEERFAFDLEFFVAARAAGICRMAPAPVVLSERLAGSTVGAAALLRTLNDLLVVTGRRYLTSNYRLAGKEAVLPLTRPELLQAA